MQAPDKPGGVTGYPHPDDTARFFISEKADKFFQKEWDKSEKIME